MNKNVKLKITDITWNGDNQVKTGTPVAFSVTLTNDGTEDMVAAKQQTVVQLHIDRAEPLWFRYDGGLKVGESKTFDFPAWEAVAGNHVITATVNFAMPSPTTWDGGEWKTVHLRVADEALSVPALAAQAGMNTLAFSDDFTTLDTIDVNATGAYGYKWYPTRPYGASTLKPTDYEITQKGLLLKQEKNPFNYGLNMMDIRTGAGWGFTFGYMEARFRMPARRVVEGIKGSPAIWSFPPAKLWSQCEEWVEMDWMEYWGDKFSEDLLYTVTMHHQCMDYANHKIEFWARNKNTSHHFGLDDGDWHTMGWLWEKGRLTTYVDGKEIMTQRWSKEGNPEPECAFNEGEPRTGVFSLFDDQVMPVIINGGAGWPLEIAYLNIWQK